MCWMNCVPVTVRRYESLGNRVPDTVVGGSGSLIYGSAIWLLRVELSGDIERMEPEKRGFSGTGLDQWQL